MYYSTSSRSQNFNPLYRMDITNRKTAGVCVCVWVGACIHYFIHYFFAVLDNSAYRFRVDDHYLFVSRKNMTKNKQSDMKSRRLYVSSNYFSSKVHFVEVQLPSLKDQQVKGLHMAAVELISDDELVVT